MKSQKQAKKSPPKKAVSKPVPKKTAGHPAVHSPVKKKSAKHALVQEKLAAKKPVVTQASASEQVRELTDVIFFPLITEKAVAMIEKENKLGFVVSDSASKAQVQKAVQDVYAVKVVSVNVIRDRKGRKKAFVKLDKAFKASDLAIKLGIL